VDLARAECGGSQTASRVAVLGAAVKPGSDDIRESRALEIAVMLQHEGAHVRVHDPKALRRGACVEFPELTYTENALDACEDADVILHLTEWSDCAELDPNAVADITCGRSSRRLRGLSVATFPALCFVNRAGIIAPLL
jgi:UDPglucose 6-dehydrogenase